MFNKLFSNTLKAFKLLIGRDFYRYRVVFYENDLEIAFVSDSLLGSTRTYINGDQVNHRWPPLFDFYGNTKFTRDGVDYRIRHHMSYVLTCAQKLTLFVDGVEAQSKIDAHFGNLTSSQVLHMAFGIVLFGLSVGFILNALGV